MAAALSCTLHNVEFFHLPRLPGRLRFNGLNRPESLDKQEFSGGVAESGQGRAGVETAGFCGDSGSICQQFEGIVYLGRKQRLHDRWRGENLPSPWRRTRPSTRKLLSADSFILVDIYQVNYPVPSNVYYYEHRLFSCVCVCVRDYKCNRGLSIWKFCCVFLRPLL